MNDDWKFVFNHQVEKSAGRRVDLPHTWNATDALHGQLKGVCRHEDHAGSGNALAPWQHREDIDIILDMGANAIRLSHYPQSPYFYELLDRYGIIAWCEIPFVGPGGYNYTGFVDQATFRDNGKQQLVEMIRQNYNHPSILMWGLYNELNVKGDNAFSILDVLRSMKGVKVKSVVPEKQSKKEYLLALRGAVDEVNLAKAGKVKLKTFDELLGEI